MLTELCGLFDVTDRKLADKFDSSRIAGVTGALHIVFADKLFVPVDIIHFGLPFV